VGPCDALGPAGRFDDVTPPGGNTGSNGITSVQLDRVHTGTIFVGTDGKGLFKSTDCGATWAKINTGRNGDVLDSGIIWVLRVDPIDPDVMYAGSLYGSNLLMYKSINGGVDWDTTMPAGGNVASVVDFFQEVALDPTDHLHLVVSFHNDCTGPYKMCMAESTDGGGTWRLFQGPTPGWTEDARPILLDAERWLYVAVEGGVYFTADRGQTWEATPLGGGSAVYRATTGTYYLTSLYGTQQSPDGHAWSTISGSPNSTAIAGDGQHIFLGLRYPAPGGPIYYISDETDGSTWTPYPSPSNVGPTVFLAYDDTHHVMYSVNNTSGLFRFVTQ
jgi:hypothetical protein